MNFTYTILFAALSFICMPLSLVVACIVAARTEESTKKSFALFKKEVNANFKFVFIKSKFKYYKLTIKYIILGILFGLFIDIVIYFK